MGSITNRDPKAEAANQTKVQARRRKLERAPGLNKAAQDQPMMNQDTHVDGHVMDRHNEKGL